MNFYNENDPKAAAWLRELIKAGEIPPGDVDERSILDVKPHELERYTQCHFFAGIGGWSYALRLAGWPDDEPVWTGSCPCQPFSVAGKGLGENDARHLWPEFHRLIAKCRPATVFGEQVASKAGRLWLAGIRTDLEALAYAFGGADLCAPGVGAPHIRQRLFWMAHSSNSDGRRGERGAQTGTREDRERGWGPSSSGFVVRVGHATTSRREGRDTELLPSRQAEGRFPGGSSDAGGMGVSESGRDGQASVGRSSDQSEASGRQRGAGRPGAWGAFDLVHCRDGKTRRVESGTFPLAHGVPGRVGLLRGYGNAIVPQLAAEFIQAAREAIG